MPTTITIEIDETTLRKLIKEYLSNLLRVDLQEKNIKIEVKSKQNYKSEWEEAAFRATVDQYNI